MSKEELIEAINATIVPNDVKGITAESLANLLTEMVNASSGGTGGGVVFYVGSVDMDTLEATQSPEQMAHNAVMFKIVADSPMGVPVSINMNGLYEAQFGVSEGLTYIETALSVMYASEELATSMGAPASLIELYGETFSATIFADGTLVLDVSA